MLLGGVPNMGVQTRVPREAQGLKDSREARAQQGCFSDVGGAGCVCTPREFQGGEEWPDPGVPTSRPFTKPKGWPGP